MAIGGLTAPSYVSYPYTTGGPPVGWADSLLPYIKSTALFDCPDAGNNTASSCKPGKVSYTDYWMNHNLSGLTSQQIVHSGSTILVGEGGYKGDKNDATYSKSTLPATWLSDVKSPAYRHLGGANYLIADGSVHWLKPDQVMTFGARKSAFAIR